MDTPMQAIVSANKVPVSHPAMTARILEATSLKNADNQAANAPEVSATPKNTGNHVDLET